LAVADVRVTCSRLNIVQVAGQILEVEDMVQTEATRKRMKHLAHLPLSGRHSVSVCLGAVLALCSSDNAPRPCARLYKSLKSRRSSLSPRRLWQYYYRRTRAVTQRDLADFPTPIVSPSAVCASSSDYVTGRVRQAWLYINTSS